MEWMPGIDKMLITDEHPDTVRSEIEQAELIICLDFNSLDRIDKTGEMVNAQTSAAKVLIDHHLDPEPFADYVLSDTTASSTSELVFDFIHLLGMENYLDQRVADCIYTGIITDTGSFRYSTSAKLFRTVARLLELGVQDVVLQDLINNNLREKHLRLLGYCLYHRMEILEEYRTGIIVLSKEDYARFDIQRGDTEGIVNYLLRMPTVKVAAFITEQPTIVKMSFRSKGEFSVQEIASQHFKGGGHRNASGGFSYIGLWPTVRKFKELLPQYQDKLLQD
jgi:phosphoesterase RecJ-like protein